MVEHVPTSTIPDSKQACIGEIGGILIVSIILASQHDDAAVEAHEEHDRIDWI